jgi:site-specific recombinase XerD
VLIELRVRKEHGLVLSRAGGSKLSRSTLEHQHATVRQNLNMSDDFVLHSFRHTMLTRLGEAGADAFTIMKVAGHSTVTVSQRYIHPTPETLERAFDRLEIENETAARKAEVRVKEQAPATVLATSVEPSAVAVA